MSSDRSPCGHPAVQLRQPEPGDDISTTPGAGARARRSGGTGGWMPRWIRRRVLARHHADTLARARRTAQDRVRRGEHLGPPPYGYRRTRPTGTSGSPLFDLPDPEAPEHADAARRWVRIPDPQTAPIVATIFRLRVERGLGPTRIARLLAADPHQHPGPTVAGHDRPDRGWTPARVRAVLTNPVYTGIAVHGRTREGRPAPVTEWITSGPYAHPALISPQRYRAAQPRPRGPRPRGS